MQQLVFLSVLVADLWFERPLIMDGIQHLMKNFFCSFHSSTKFLEICYQDNMRTQLVKDKFNFSYYAIAPKRGSLYVTCLLGYWN